MKKTRDWLDYAAVGAEVVQAAQLSSISSNLENLARLCAAQATAQADQHDREQRAKAAEDRIREFTFQGERLIRDMRSRINANPRGALFVASRLRMQIEAGGIVTNRVRDYRDKENIQRLIDGVANFCDDCAKQLSFEDAMTVQTCLDYQSDEPELREAIDWAKGLENAVAQRRASAAELELKQRELDSVQKTRPRFHPAVSYTALVIAMLSLTLPLLWLPPKALALFGGIAAYFMWIFLAGIMRRETTEALALRTEIESLQEEAAEPVSDDAPSQLVTKFGNKSAAEYEELFRERQQAINELLEPGAVTPAQ